MKKQLSHSTKYIDVKIKQYHENAKHGLYTNTDYKELLYQRLDKRIHHSSNRNKDFPRPENGNAEFLLKRNHNTFIYL